MTYISFFFFLPLHFRFTMACKHEQLTYLNGSIFCPLCLCLPLIHHSSVLRLVANFTYALFSYILSQKYNFTFHLAYYTEHNESSYFKIDLTLQIFHNFFLFYNDTRYTFSHKHINYQQFFFCTPATRTL